jgi:hypothetical protein
MMPRITYLKEIDGQLWARLELDMATADGPVHIFTDKEIRELRDRERQTVRDEIEASLNKWSD